MSLVGDWRYMWSYGPMCEVAEDPMHQADMTIVELAHVTGVTEETQAAVDRIRERGIWCYEEGGRRYQRALDAYRHSQDTEWTFTDWWTG